MGATGQGKVGRHQPAFVCEKCKAADCENCVDVLRAIYSDKMICMCNRARHSGEPVNEQIRDPETGAVHTPGLIISENGEVKRR